MRLGKSIGKGIKSAASHLRFRARSKAAAPTAKPPGTGYAAPPTAPGGVGEAWQQGLNPHP